MSHDHARADVEALLGEGSGDAIEIGPACRSKPNEGLLSQKPQSKYETRQYGRATAKFSSL